MCSHNRDIKHSDECPCGTGPQTPNRILQSCPTFDDLRRQTWPSLVEAHRKLWGPVETLRQTADFALSHWKSSMAGNAQEEEEEDIKLAVSPRRSMLTPGQPVLALTCNVGRVATEVAICMSQVYLIRQHRVWSPCFPLLTWTPYHVAIEGVQGLGVWLWCLFRWTVESAISSEHDLCWWCSSSVVVLSLVGVVAWNGCCKQLYLCQCGSNVVLSYDCFLFVIHFQIVVVIFSEDDHYSSISFNIIWQIGRKALFVLYCF